MGFDDPCFGDSEDDMIRTLLDSAHPFVRGITLEESGARDIPCGCGWRRRRSISAFRRGRIRHASGKCEFHAESLDYTPPVESRFGDEGLRARFPLELISPKNDDSMNSTFGNRPENDAATATLHIEAADAAARGIAHRRPGARLQRPRLLPVARASGRRGAPGRGLRALGALGQHGAGPPQRQRAHLRAADRQRRRTHIL